MTDDKRTIVWAADYTPFGEATITIDRQTLNHRLPGQYADSETGTHYNYFRDYDPATGRYLTSDPTSLSGGVNTYIYANNAPTALTDMLGLATEPVPTSPALVKKPAPDFASKLGAVIDYTIERLKQQGTSTMMFSRSSKEQRVLGSVRSMATRWY